VVFQEQSTWLKEDATFPTCFTKQQKQKQEWRSNDNDEEIADTKKSAFRFNFF
jgi:hypothetical protein